MQLPRTLLWLALVGAGLTMVVSAQEAEPSSAPVQVSPVQTGPEELQDPDVFEDDEFFDDDLFLDDDLDALLGGELPDEGGSAEALGAPQNQDPLRSYKGFLEFRPRVFFEDRNQGRNDEQALWEGELELDFRWSDSLSAYLRPRFFLDLADGDLSRFEPFEAYVDWEFESWDLRAGQFVENWGIADTTNPVDLLNRRDFAVDPLDPDRLGEFGLRYRSFFDGGETIGEPTLSFYALPVFRRAPFPPEDQRFGFALGDTRLDEDPGLEPEGFDRGFYAARFQSTLSTAPFDADLQLIAARGPERAPNFALEGGSFVPAYYGATSLGGGLRAVPNEDVAGRFLSTLTLKAEVVHKDPYTLDGADFDIPEGYTAYVFGVDRSFYGLFSDQDALTLTLEYAGESGANDLAATFRPFRDDLIARAFYERGDFARSTFELRSLFDLDVDETIIEFIAETQLRSIHEDLKLIVEARFFDTAAADESFFGIFPDNSSFAIGLRYDF